MHAEHGIRSVARTRSTVTVVPGGGVRAGVGEQVRGDLVQAPGVAGDRDRLLAHLEHPDVVGAGRPGIADRLDREPREVDGAVDELLALVEPRQQQQILDEGRHAERLGLDALERRLGGLDRARIVALVRARSESSE